jgi:hypothetical protein
MTTLHGPILPSAPAGIWYTSPVAINPVHRIRIEYCVP